MPRAWRCLLLCIGCFITIYLPARAIGAPGQGMIVLVTSVPATLTSTGQSGLWRATPVGAVARLRARPGASGLSDAVLSPSGKHIAFVEDGQTLWTMDSDGTHAKLLYALSLASESRISGPHYTPDGGTIAFTSGCCANYAIYSIAADGTKLRILLKGGGPRIFQDWSPDGSTMLYSYGGVLWTADARGGHARPLSGDAPGAGSFLSARYSPDGTHIIASLRPAQGTEAAATAIVLMHADGQYLTPLTTNLNYDVGTPSWSPDGKQVAFVVSSGAEGALGRSHDLWIMRYDGSRKRNVTHGKLGDVVEAGWAR